MWHRYRVSTVLGALLLLQSAGCALSREQVWTAPETPHGRAEYAPHFRITETPVDQPTTASSSPGRANVSPPAEVAADDVVRLGEPSRPSAVEPASWQKLQDLPDLVIPPPAAAPPPAVASGEESQEPPPAYPPYSPDIDGGNLATATEQIVVPVPPPPQGWVKRLLNRVGCADDETPEPLLIEAAYFSSSGEVPAPDRWWTTFNNWDLNRQIEYSLGENLTLASALQRLRAAAALARREESDLLPDLNGVSNAEGTFRSFGPDDGLFSLGLDASYQVDLWGQIESRVEAEWLRASATREDYHAIALTLSAEIARAWFSLIEAHAQLELLDEQLETNLLGLKLQETRFRGGDERVGSADVLRQRQLVESTREQMVIARSRVDVLEHRLAVLEGRPPQDATYDVGSSLPALQPLPSTGLPSGLVHRRPDVRRDYLALLAADRDLAAAITDRYPRLDLGGSLTTLATRSTNLLQDWVFVIAGQVFAPILDGGQRQAEIDRTDAVLRQLIADYGQTVLVAFSEVEDALALEYYQSQRVESLQKQYDLARQASKELRDRYFGFGEEIGETEYLDVLTATTTEQRLQRDILSARLNLILTRISLYLALAGGFDPNPQYHLGIGPPHTVIDERPFQATNSTPLDTDPGLDRRLPLHLRSGGSHDRGDQPDATDRTADRGHAEVGSAR
ncbi:Cation efflux system protein CusC precursor [Maioricimonas rarisocia]|uniref:Cation efflux system protein CusC n=1 Tax=Maioricimonas rarisocia TaxID=2528026 RepID=A0A517Z5I9_9PLAN|nr:TolC family protein [Maioricimonas rarisocia]QDU37758.1 Cation efflux system protein CusC precursor [Maioricimonas rarisocia]